MLQRICQILIFLLPMICQQAQAQIFTPQHPIYIVNGVMLITLRYDTPASFRVDGKEQSFSSFVADMVEWKYPNPAARVILSFKVNPDGTTSLNKVLESTDKRLLKCIEKAMAAAPKWSPALKDGKPISTQHVLRITLPKGATVQREKIVISRW